MQAQIGLDTDQEGQEYNSCVMQLLGLFSKQIILDRERRQTTQGTSLEDSDTFFSSFLSLYNQLKHHEQMKQHIPKFSDAVTDLARALGIIYKNTSQEDGSEKHFHSNNQGEKDISKSTIFGQQVAAVAESSERTVTEGTPHINRPARQPRQQQSNLRGSYDSKNEKENTTLSAAATNKNNQRLLPPLVERKHTSLHNTRYKNTRSQSRNAINESANQTESNFLYRESVQYMKNIQDNNKQTEIANDSQSQTYHVADPMLKHEADQFLSQFNKLYSNLISYRQLTPEQSQQLQATSQISQIVQQPSIPAEGQNNQLNLQNGQEQYKSNTQQSKKHNLQVQKQKQEQERNYSNQRQHNRQLIQGGIQNEQFRMTQNSFHQENLPFTIAPEQVDYRVKQIEQLAGNGIPSAQYRSSQPHLSGLQSHETADEAALKTLRRISAKNHAPDPWEPKKPLVLDFASSSGSGNLDQSFIPGLINQNNTANPKNQGISNLNSTIHCESPLYKSKTANQNNNSLHEKQHQPNKSQQLQQYQIQAISPTSLAHVNVNVISQSNSLKPAKSPYLPQKVIKHHQKQTPPLSAIDLDSSIQTIFQQSRAYSLSGKTNTKQMASDSLRLKTDFISEEEEEDFAASNDKLQQIFPQQDKSEVVLVSEQQ